MKRWCQISVFFGRRCTGSVGQSRSCGSVWLSPLKRREQASQVQSRSAREGRRAGHPPRVDSAAARPATVLPSQELSPPLWCSVRYTSDQERSATVPYQSSLLEPTLLLAGGRREVGRGGERASRLLGIFPSTSSEHASSLGRGTGSPSSSQQRELPRDPSCRCEMRPTTTQRSRARGQRTWVGVLFSVGVGAGERSRTLTEDGSKRRGWWSSLAPCLGLNRRG